MCLSLDFVAAVDKDYSANRTEMTTANKWIRAKYCVHPGAKTMPGDPRCTGRPGRGTAVFKMVQMQGLLKLRR